jgi:oligo-1,6-glucosidase/alpha-glucosidase
MRNRATQQADPGSMLHLYRRLLALRKARPELRHGDLSLLDAPGGVLAFSRRRDLGICHVLINMTDESVELDESLAPLGATVVLASDVVELFEPVDRPAHLGPDQAIILSV